MDKQMPPKDKKYFQIGSLEKGMKILELLVDSEEMSVSEVAARLGMNRSASHRFLATLREMGYVEKNANARYQATFRIFELGMKVADRFEIRRMARPYLRELQQAYNETVNLGYWDGQQIIHLDKVESREILRMDPGIGTPSPAYCTGLGKAILAFLPEEELNYYLSSVVLEPLTPNTIASKQKLMEELNLTRQRGYAIDNEELSRWLRCVASPVFGYGDHPVFAISVSGPISRMTDSLVEKISIDVQRVCELLSTHLGKSESRR